MCSLEGKYSDINAFRQLGKESNAFGSEDHNADNHICISSSEGGNKIKIFFEGFFKIHGYQNLKFSEK